MRTTTRRLTATTAAVALALTVAACSGADEPAGQPTDGTATATEQDAATEAADEHNDADTEFAQMMIVHHQGALEMAELALDKASTDDVRDLAQRIYDAQDPEIQQMSGWLEAWGEEQSDAMDHGGMDMEGMDQEGAMASLEQLEGVDFDRSFLDLMTAHHQGAIEMAEEQLEDGASPDALNLARAIIDAQTAEIDEMQEMLGKL
ncbi:DUF305 domain-containing protein [Actinotalea ferrariae]|uniref:DUF305 domain-containing protein n=1 Tax=Actinotalea ferrariae TaxID=1386098 RepID=UPI001C8B2F19|nr:DUF305 domain-containing protein [Actinotalea ferrariae]MBX9245838.1 DUF305 domain-containing protein [Actinotalea ferrariae]